jgi:hypothetical protein
MDAKTRAKIKATTQEHIEIVDAIDDLAITKSGSVAMLIQTNAVNFDLLSEHEQDSKIYAFAGLLNSLNFPIQIMIKTHRIDISNYINYLKVESDRPMSDGLRYQLNIYTQFVQNLIVTNDVLDKKFFIVIPYNPAFSISGAKLKKTSDSNSILSESQKAKALEQGKIFLQPKRDHVLKQLGRMGLMGHQLVTDELIGLMYSFYNPEE